MYACEYGCGYLSSNYDQVVDHENECHRDTHVANVMYTSRTQGYEVPRVSSESSCSYCGFVAVSLPQAQQHALQYHGVVLQTSDATAYMPPGPHHPSGRRQRMPYGSVVMGTGGWSPPSSSTRHAVESQRSDSNSVLPCGINSMGSPPEEPHDIIQACAEASEAKWWRTISMVLLPVLMVLIAITPWHIVWTSSTSWTRMAGESEGERHFLNIHHILLLSHYWG